MPMPMPIPKGQDQAFMLQLPLEGALQCAVGVLLKNVFYLTLLCTVCATHPTLWLPLRRCDTNRKTKVTPTMHRTPVQCQQ